MLQLKLQDYKIVPAIRKDERHPDLLGILSDILFLYNKRNHDIADLIRSDKLDEAKQYADAMVSPLNALNHRLESAGARVRISIPDKGCMVICICDKDGNQLEVEKLDRLERVAVMSAGSVILQQAEQKVGNEKGNG